MKGSGLTWALGAAALGGLAFMGKKATEKWGELRAGCLTGSAALDRLAPLVARELFTQTLGYASVADARACMAIVANESGGRAPPVVGDATLSGGPSIGPMQVYRSTAVDMNLWSPPTGASEDDARDAYADLANDEGACVAMGVSVYLEKLRIAQGDTFDAIRRYNGGGAAALNYQSRALAFVTSTWGSLSA